jgi:hypothetical protein
MIAELMNAFDFTAEDLTLNKSGQLSARQLDRLADWSRRTKIGSVIVALILGTVAVFVMLPIAQTLSLEGNVGRLIGGLALAAVALLFFSALFDKQKIDIQSAQGKAQFVRRDTDTTDEDGIVTTTTSHYVVIGGHEFTVKTKQYDAFNQGHIYTVYHMQHPLGILSIEYVGPPEV